MPTQTLASTLETNMNIKKMTHLIASGLKNEEVRQEQRQETFRKATPKNPNPGAEGYGQLQGHYHDGTKGRKEHIQLLFKSRLRVDSRYYTSPTSLFRYKAHKTYSTGNRGAKGRDGAEGKASRFLVESRSRYHGICHTTGANADVRTVPHLRPHHPLRVHPRRFSVIR